MHRRRSGAYAPRSDAAAIDGAGVRHRTGRAVAPNASDLRTSHGEDVAAQIPAKSQSQDDANPHDKASTAPSTSQSRRRKTLRTVNGGSVSRPEGSGSIDHGPEAAYRVRHTPSLQSQAAGRPSGLAPLACFRSDSYGGDSNALPNLVTTRPSGMVNAYELTRQARRPDRRTFGACSRMPSPCPGRRRPRCVSVS